MLFIPLSPEYARTPPYGTLGLIAANVLVALACATDVLTPDASFTLVYGTLNPIQWFTSAFLHADFLHLLFNMIALWAFGLVIEGLSGTTRFLAFAMAVMALDGLLVQLLMLGHESTGIVTDALEAEPSGPAGAIGASGMIFGLAAAALIFAPTARLRCLYWFFLLPRLTWLSVWVVAAILFALNAVSVLIDVAGGDAASLDTAGLHLVGATAGAILGVIALKTQFLNSQGWDIFSDKIRRQRW